MSGLMVWERECGRGSIPPAVLSPLSEPSHAHYNTPCLIHTTHDDLARHRDGLPNPIPTESLIMHDALLSATQGRVLDETAGSIKHSLW
eukprot:38968-Eustigmatos_ZCMA.PRE.1